MFYCRQALPRLLPIQSIQLVFHKFYTLKILPFCPCLLERCLKKKCLKKGVIFLTKCSPFFDIFLKLLHIFLLSNFPVVILSLQINWCINPAYLDRVLSPWNNLPALNGDFIVNCPNTMLSIIYTQYIHFKDCSTQQDMILISSHHGIILQLGWLRWVLSKDPHHNRFSFSNH